jgi:hypothetical protein
MSILTTFPREIRDQILSYVIQSYQNVHPTLDQAFEELISGREVLHDVKLGSWSNIVLNDPKSVAANATNLLLTNHQLYAETLEIIKLQCARVYELDVIILDEILPILTWLRVPIHTTNLDKIEVKFRISGCYDENKGARRRSEDDSSYSSPYAQWSTYTGFRGGCGAGPAMSWQIYSILERFLKAGPVGRTGIDKEHMLSADKDGFQDQKHRHVVVKTIDIKVETPPHVDPLLFGPPRGSGYRRDRRSEKTVLSPHYLADFIKFEINQLLRGGDHEYFSYGKILYEHVDTISISVDGENLETFDVAQRLKDVGGFKERYITPEVLARYKKVTWQKRKERGLRVLEDC